MCKLKIAVVGCGRISKNHFEAIQANCNELELVSVCDILEDRAIEAATKYSVHSYTSLEKMLSEEEIDLISICTPSGLHAEHGILAAKKGCHVITEKPMATSVEDAEKLISTCDLCNVRLFVVKQNRLNSTLQMVKRAIDKNRFGKIHMAIVNVFWTRPQSYYDESPWRGTWKYDGGAFMNQASHYVDMIEWLIGPVASVMAYTATQARNIEAEDSGVAAVRFCNGAMGTINVNMLTYPKNYEGSITIMGETGTIKVGGIAVNKIEMWDFMNYDDDDKLVDNSAYNPPNVYGFGHSGYYRNVINVLRNTAVPDTDGREGLKSLELISAIYKSASNGIQVNDVHSLTKRVGI